MPELLAAMKALLLAGRRPNSARELLEFGDFEFHRQRIFGIWNGVFGALSTADRPRRPARRVVGEPPAPHPSDICRSAFQLRLHRNRQPHAANDFQAKLER